MQVAAIAVAVAIVAEVCGTMALQASDGWTRPGPTVIVVIAYALSFYALSRALRTLDVGVVYAVWAGAGTAFVAVLGVAFLGEPVTAPRVASLALIVAGVVSLSLQEAH